MNNKYCWVYILNCADGSYYTGYTTDLNKRYKSHLSGTGSKYTRSFKPISLALSLKIMGEKSLAMKIERAIKKLSRLQKENLIANPSLLFELCNCTFLQENLIINEHVTHT